MLNSIGWLLSVGAISNASAFATIMLSSGNPWNNGHQLAQAFMYKWLRRMSYAEVKLEHTFSTTGERADVIARRGNNLEIFEIKHRTAPYYNNYAHAKQVLSEANDQLTGYYNTLDCIIRQKQLQYSLIRGSLDNKETETFVLFQLNNREICINLRGCRTGVVEYWFSTREKKEPEKVYELAPDKAIVKYEQARLNETRREAIINAIAATEIGLAVSIGIVASGALTVVSLYNLGSVSASYLAAIPEAAGILIQKGAEILYQVGIKISPVPALAQP